MEIYRRKSREKGLKVTPQRAAIYEELLRARDHPTAEAVYRRVLKRMPNISFDTVNRTLLTFAQIGITKIVEGYGQAKRYDPDMDTHHHFRCVQCGSIIDFHHKDYDDLPVPAEINRQFQVTGKKVVLEGLCGKCRKA